MDMKNNKINIIKIILTIFITSLISCLMMLMTQNLNKNTNHYDANILKVVEVAAYDEIENKSYGSAWFLDNNTIVTNYHVLSYVDHGERENFDHIDIRFYDSDQYEAVILKKYDEVKDVAFLQYEGNHKHSSFITNNRFSTSEKCYSIGNFLNYGLSYKEGYISLSEIKLLYNKDYSNFIQCTISIGSGDSGAPLFNKKNEVIGMITFRTKGLNGNVEQCFAYAIPIDSILKIMD